MASSRVFLFVVLLISTMFLINEFIMRPYRVILINQQFLRNVILIYCCINNANSAL